MAILIAIIIIVPIIYHKISGAFTGALMMHMMSLPKEVVVNNPESKDVNITVDTTGRVEAQYSVDVMARVSGFLQKKYFNEGDFVKKGQKIFQIDPREYQLEVNNTKANINQYNALLLNSQKELDRANALIKEDLVSHSMVDQSLATRNQNSALLDAARQKYQLAQVNLGYTTIVSPCDGRIGKIQITEGNYVSLTSGPLVNISSVDPVYVTFSVKGNDFYKMLKASDKFKDVQVKVQFSNGEWYDEIGTVNFVDNQVDENSGTVKMRATFKNPNWELVPGDYLNVKLIAPTKVKFMVVPQAATKGDAMSGYYVWAVEKDTKQEKPTFISKFFSKLFKQASAKDNLKAVRKDIKITDDLDNNWIVESGLSYGDTIVVSGIQRITDEGQHLTVITQEEYDKKQKKEGK